MFSSLRSRISCCRLQQKLRSVLQRVIDVRSEYCTQSPLHRHLSSPVCLWVSCSHQCRLLTLRCCGTTRMIVYNGLWRNYWRESIISASTLCRVIAATHILSVVSGCSRPASVLFTCCSLVILTSSLCAVLSSAQGLLHLQPEWRWWR